MIRDDQGQQQPEATQPIAAPGGVPFDYVANPTDAAYRVPVTNGSTWNVSQQPATGGAWAQSTPQAATAIPVHHASPQDLYEKLLPKRDFLLSTKRRRVIPSLVIVATSDAALRTAPQIREQPIVMQSQSVSQPPVEQAKVSQSQTPPTQHVVPENPVSQPAEVPKKMLAKNPLRFRKRSNGAETPTKTAKNPESKPKQKKAIGSLLFRYGLIVVILGVTGFLAYDTWMSNRKVLEEVTAVSQPPDSTDPNTASEATVTESDYDSYKVTPGSARYLTIPSQNIAARVMPVGVNAQGQIQAPISIYDVGLYGGGSNPGSPGAAFIDGHIAGATKTAIFTNLNKLRNGDDVYVEMGDGTKYHYKVQAVETLPLAQVDMVKALQTYKGAEQGLNIMTCAGTYNAGLKTYDKRIIVYTTRVDE